MSVISGPRGEPDADRSRRAAFSGRADPVGACGIVGGWLLFLCGCGGRVGWTAGCRGVGAAFGDRMEPSDWFVSVEPSGAISAPMLEKDQQGGGEVESM